MKYIITMLIVLALLIAPAFGLSVGISGGNGGQVTSVSTKFSLSDDSAILASTVLKDGQAQSTLSATGSGGITATSNGVSAMVAGEFSANIEMAGDTIKGDATLSGVPFGIDARPDFGFVGEAITGDGSTIGQILTGPDYMVSGGNTEAHSLTGRKWVQEDPNIQLYVNPSGSSFTAGQMWRETTAAAETWDAATNQELFSNQGIATTARPGSYDKRNTIGFMAFNSGCTALASTGTWYRTTKVDGYYPVVESDIAFNNRYGWTTTGESGKIDYQSVVLHELGHTIGLGDIYNKAQFSKDTRQVMHYYTGVKRTLGNGDKTGVWKLYG